MNQIQKWAGARQSTDPEFGSGLGDLAGGPHSPATAPSIDESLDDMLPGGDQGVTDDDLLSAFDNTPQSPSDTTLDGLTGGGDDGTDDGYLDLLNSGPSRPGQGTGQGGGQDGGQGDTGTDGTPQQPSDSTSSDPPPGDDPPPPDPPSDDSGGEGMPTPDGGGDGNDGGGVMFFGGGGPSPPEGDFEPGAATPRQGGDGSGGSDDMEGPNHRGFAGTGDVSDPDTPAGHFSPRAGRALLAAFRSGAAHAGASLPFRQAVAAAFITGMFGGTNSRR